MKKKSIPRRGEFRNAHTGKQKLRVFKAEGVSRRRGAVINYGRFFIHRQLRRGSGSLGIPYSSPSRLLYTINSTCMMVPLDQLTTDTPKLSTRLPAPQSTARQTSPSVQSARKPPSYARPWTWTILHSRRDPGTASTFNRPLLDPGASSLRLAEDIIAVNSSVPAC